MSDLKEVFKPKTVKNTSSKTPQFYNNEKKLCLEDMVNHPDAKVRSAIVSNIHMPTRMLNDRLKIEKDKSVLRLILMNANLSRKSVAEFVNDAADKRVEWFSDDQDLIDHFTTE